MPVQGMGLHSRNLLLSEVLGKISAPCRASEPGAVPRTAVSPAEWWHSLLSSAPAAETAKSRCMKRLGLFGLKTSKIEL